MSKCLFLAHNFKLLADRLQISLKLNDHKTEKDLATLVHEIYDLLKDKTCLFVLDNVDQESVSLARFFQWDMQICEQTSAGGGGKLISFFLRSLTFCQGEASPSVPPLDPTPLRVCIGP